MLLLPAAPRFVPIGKIREGSLSVVRRRGVQTRHCVLYHNRLDYYYSEDEAAEGAEPRGRIALADVRGFEATESEFRLHLDAHSAATLAFGAVGGVDLQPWIDDLRAILGQEEQEEQHEDRSQEAAHAAQEGLEEAEEEEAAPAAGNAAPAPLPEEEQEEHEEEEAAPAAGNAAPAPLPADPHLALQDVHPPLQLLHLRGLDVGEAVVQVRPAAPRWRMPGIMGKIREGPLGVVKRRGVETRHVVLYHNRLDYYYCREDEAVEGAMPRGRLALADVRRFEATGSQLRFHVDSALTFVLSAVDGGDLQPWIDDLRAILASDPTATDAGESSEDGADSSSGSWDDSGLQDELGL